MKDNRTYEIIGAAMEVHKELGFGFLEAVYQEALAKEFVFQEIPCKAQPVIDIFYKGELLEKRYQPDFICYDEIIVEIKALSALSGLEEAQLINYLKATGLKVGLLLNLGNKSPNTNEWFIIFNLQTDVHRLRGLRGLNDNPSNVGIQTQKTMCPQYNLLYTKNIHCF